ncbi:MAG: hypothetical protein COV74_07965 [Candidatus Omnitrophica bacterium CG11_big_fil_rev_8_21_14_0_20_45_26]|uniref:Dienelactone hydrolase domain-containing protein n=1 Tax=Candidatus Abzuiibacterium crystallinum TaxID=1974748 RepID=A0A2H0LQ50_9BACT|nr:MAG: hypothetical protein COV74_07965 [Candidatus Omnitrophica bacterium CG11_big_fil_rev_8_21_14_0_20_45_26]PIW65156.1 MAG: hypothetical protein COW12_03005 [Candidatus Omnitrophica bacterium CG12_big_fil_rev_8_21_14_0_65_45_16]
MQKIIRCFEFAIFVTLIIVSSLVIEPGQSQATFFGDVKTGFYDLKSDRYGVSYFIPKSYTADHEWPLVVVLYTDEGEKGSQSVEKWTAELTKRNEPGLFIAHLRPQDVPFSSDKRILKRIEEFKSIHRIDPKKVLLTGFGEAAHYAFYFALRYPETVSAAALMGGGADGPFAEFYKDAQNGAKKLPILVLYGDQDKTITKDSFIPLHEQLYQEGYRLELEEYEGLQHLIYPEFRKRALDWFSQLTVTQAADQMAERPSMGALHTFVSIVRGVLQG